MSELASCPPIFDWTKNAVDNDPCALGSSLIGLCDTSGQFEGLTPLQPGTVYPLPAHETADKCTCSSVVYALVSVCSSCQNAGYSSWQAWSSSCNKVYTPNFPIVTDIPIPQWAFYNVQIEPTFDIVRARNSVIKSPQAPTTPNVTDTPLTPEANNTSSISTSATEMTSLPMTTSANQTYNITPAATEVSTPSSALLTSSDAQMFSSSESIGATQASGADPAAVTIANQSDSQSSPSIATSTKKGTNTGAIAGGTIAGVIGLVVVGGLAFWWIRRHRRSRIAPSAAYIAAYGAARPSTMVSQRGVSPFVTKTNPIVPYHDEDFRSSAYSDSRQPSNTDNYSV